MLSHILVLGILVNILTAISTALAHWHVFFIDVKVLGGEDSYTKYSDA